MVAAHTDTTQKKGKEKKYCNMQYLNKKRKKKEKKRRRIVRKQSKWTGS